MFGWPTCQDFVVIKWGGVTTAVVATATAACGLLMLSGVGPAPAGAGDLTVPEAALDVEQPSTSTTTTTTTTATTTSTTASAVTSSTTTPPLMTPIPLSVAPQSVTVGVGGIARITGECPVVGGEPLGPVEIWQIGSAVTAISTGVTAATWSYDWTAPGDVEPLVLQVWCGDPSQYAGGYPESLQIEVVFVDQAPATTTTTVAGRPDHVIPETG